MFSYKKIIIKIGVLFCFLFSAAFVSAKPAGKFLYFLDKKTKPSVGAPFGQQNYIFIRLYDPSYKSKLYVENLLQNGMSITQVNPETVSHASIGFDLSDYYFGLTAGGKYNLKIERCMDVSSNKYMKKCNPIFSTQSVYVIPVTPEEYERAYSLVYKNLTNRMLKYAALENIPIAGRSVKRKFFTKEEEKALESAAMSDKLYDAKKFFKDLINDPDFEHKFVCSGFVSWVLYNSVDSVKAWCDENKVDYKKLTPSDIPHIPGVELLFSSTWENFDEAAKEFASQNPEFQAYLPQVIIKSVE